MLTIRGGKHCPKRCHNSIIRDTTCMTNIIGGSRSVGQNNVAKLFRFYRGMSSTSSQEPPCLLSVSLSLSYLYKEGHSVHMVVK